MGISEAADQQKDFDDAIQTDEAANSKASEKPELKAADKLKSEKKLAIDYLKALNERVEPGAVLQCKICNNDKTYTAATSLILHYRGHAGIKAYACDICGDAFTRTHSLKYHMLIHNQESRFTCETCYRQFRHPAHYKEHLRRHTGETPFQCSDCSKGFKSRNSYKSHLKAQHNKLLDKNGITEMNTSEA